jgi:uncharacterized membrane protein
VVIHPIFVHFPIALLLIASGGVLWRSTPKGKNVGQGLETFVDGAFGLGFAGLIMTVASGLFDMQNSPKGIALDGWLFYAILHIVSGASLVVVYGVLLFRRFVVLQREPQNGELIIPAPRSATDRPSLILSVLGLILLLAAGWLGGHMVYSYRVGV